MDGLAVGSCFQTCKGRTNIIRLLDYEFAGKERLEVIAILGEEDAAPMVIMDWARCQQGNFFGHGRGATWVLQWVSKSAKENNTHN